MARRPPLRVIEMTRALRLLSSPETLEAASDAELEQASRAIAAQLGAGWTRADAGRLAFTHVATGLAFVAVPGGTFSMGLGAADVDALSEHVDWTSELATEVERMGASARPAHAVPVRPFLCARELLLRRGTTRADAHRTAAAAGFRLISEAELEWLLRNGGRDALVLGATPLPSVPGSVRFAPSRFGVQDLTVTQWAADDWFPSHDGATGTSAPRMGGDPAGVSRSTAPCDAFVNAGDLAFLLAALRERGSERMPCAVRLVRELLVEA